MCTLFRCSLLLFLVQQVFAQGQLELFPNLSGQVLEDSVVFYYKPDSVLVWGDAKDTIFAVIDAVNDTVTCVYTGLEKWLDPSQDPSDFMAMNNDPNGMNIEHTYPQSKGAGAGNARADMHHLFPARNETNNMRGNLPFGELDDNLVTNWFYTTYNAQGIPVFNIDDYSELILNQAFEPREDWKGNVARAMFYFYTMYRAEANNADPDYFNLQKEQLCAWHFQDPVDQVEWERSYRVADFQEGKPNPFVLDCSLAKRLYCPNQISDCLATAVAAVQQQPKLLLTKAPIPNPTSSNFNIRYQLHASTRLKIELLDLNGRLLSVLINEEQDAGTYQLGAQFSENLSNGVYLLRWNWEETGLQKRTFQKIVLIR